MRLLVLIAALALVTSPAFGSRIHYAAHSGDFSRVKEIVTSDPTAITDLDSFKRTPLHYAAWQGHYDICKYLLDRGAPLEARQHDGWTPIFYAILGHHPEISELLLDRGAKINVKDQYGRTPIFHLGSITMLELARKRGAKLDIADLDGVTPLINHLRHNNHELVRYLLAHGADPNGHRRKSLDGTPLHKAVSASDTNMIRLLLTTGADPYVEDQWGFTPIQWAFLRNRAIFNYLVQSGVRYTRRSTKGTGLLHLIAGSIQDYYDDAVDIPDEILNTLLKSRNDVTAVNAAGQTPLHIAAMNGNFSLVKQLVEHGAKVNARDTINATPLHYSTGNSRRLLPKNVLSCGNGAEQRLRKFEREKAGRNASAVYLIEHHAEVNALDKERNTFMHWHEYDGCDMLLGIALTRNFRVDVVNSEGESILHSFVRGSRDSANIALLISRGLDPNQRDQYGETPLHRAIGRQPLSIVQALVAGGADVNLRTNYGTSPLQSATSWGRGDIGALLLEAGAR